MKTKRPLISSKGWRNGATIEFVTKEMSRRKRKTTAGILCILLGIGVFVSAQTINDAMYDKTKEQLLRFGANIIIQPPDEPTGNLDTKTGEDLMEYVRELNEQGVTVVLVTHDPAIADFAKRKIRIVDGRMTP
jgi:ABC-type branched-subunit amino acid transport system ATPase component